LPIAILPQHVVVNLRILVIFYGSQGAITPWLTTIFGKSKNHHTNQKKQKQNQQTYNKI
jgi:hypothetical protein